jgi:hypothetical protein
VRDDDGAVADGLDLLEQVRRDHDDLRLGHAADQLANLVLLVRIEAVGRLVEDQDIGVVHDRLGEADAPPIPFRQRVDRLLEHALEMQQLDHFVEALAPRSRRDAARVGDKLEERARRHLGIARRAFGQVADAALRLDGLRLDVGAADEHAPRRGRQEARDDAHRRRLAGAVGPQEAEHLARGDPKAQIVYGAKPTVFLR